MGSRRVALVLGQIMCPGARYVGIASLRVATKNEFVGRWAARRMRL